MRRSPGFLTKSGKYVRFSGGECGGKTSLEGINSNSNCIVTFLVYFLIEKSGVSNIFGGVPFPFFCVPCARFQLYGMHFLPGVEHDDPAGDILLYLRVF